MKITVYVCVWLAGSLPVAFGQESEDLLRISGGISLADSDGDGWDDHWLRQYPEIDPSEPWVDANGDGTPNLFKMFLNENPLAAPIRRRAKQPFEIAAGKRELAKRREASDTTIREILEPFRNDGMRDRAGNLVSRKQWEEDNRTRDWPRN